MKKSNDLVQAIIALNESEALSIVQDRLSAGKSPLSILSDTRRALQTVGSYYESGDYFIPELIFSGEIMKEISALLKPYMTLEVKTEYQGKVVIGTVEGDIHDIGKDMVAFMLEINGFEVHDLGVDICAARFLAGVEETQAQIIGLSAFLTGCIESMKSIIQAFQHEGIRDQVKIMIGGNFISDMVCNEVGADGWGKDAAAAVRLARLWTGVKDKAYANDG